MAHSSSRRENRKSMAIAMTVPQLLTPEEPLADTFVSQLPIQTIQLAVPSPPASPEFDAYSTTAAFRQNDDVLYPEHAPGDNSESDRPLFEQTNRWSTPERQHSLAAEETLSVATSSPRQTDPSSVGEGESSKSPRSRSRGDRTKPVGPVALHNYYGLDYYRYCQMQNETWREGKLAQRTLPPLGTSKRAVRDGYTQKVISSLGKSYRVEKRLNTSTPLTKPKTSKAAVAAAAAAAAAGTLTATATATATAAPPPQPPKTPTRADAASAVARSEPYTKRSRRQTSTPDASFSAFSSIVQPKPRTRAAPSKRIDDKGASDWRQIQDYCPPPTSLDQMSEKLVVQWTNSNELNLSEDPDRDQLHPQELKVAATLRLKCNQYLANKRRIFQARMMALKDGRDFNKTSAQTSTNIDVNKASRLWAAFDNVGWFDEHWFLKFL